MRCSNVAQPCDNQSLNEDQIWIIVSLGSIAELGSNLFSKPSIIKYMNLPTLKTSQIVRVPKNYTYDLVLLRNK